MQSLRHRLWPRLWRALRDELGWGFAGSLASLCLFAYMAEDVLAGNTLALDHSIIQSIRVIASPYLTYLMLGITLLGDWSILLIASLLAGGWWWQRGEKDRVIILVTTLLGSALLSQALTIFFHRFRPNTVDHLVTAQSYAPLSGHLLLALGGYGILTYLLVIGRPPGQRRVALLLALLLILAIGFSYLYLGVHYASDVLAGSIAGGVWLVANTVAYGNVRRLSPLWRLPV